MVRKNNVHWTRRLNQTHITFSFLLFPPTHATTVLESDDLSITERGVAIATASPARMEGHENFFGFLMAWLLVKTTAVSAAVSSPGLELRLFSSLQRLYRSLAYTGQS